MPPNLTLVGSVVKCNVAVPLLRSVTVCAALVVFNAWGLNVTVVGLNCTAGAVPFPLSGTDCVTPAVALLSSVNVSDAVRDPRAVGVNVTLQVQFTVFATVFGKPVWQFVPAATIAKSDAFAPVMATAVICKSSVPVLVSVPCCAVLVVLTG